MSGVSGVCGFSGLHLSGGYYNYISYIINTPKKEQDCMCMIVFVIHHLNTNMCFPFHY